MLNSKIGILRYLFLRNDKVWKRLSHEDKLLVLKANRLHNTERPDYANPELYGKSRLAGGENWSSSENRLELKRGIILSQVLENVKPEKVLEVGPGAGFYTRYICERDCVKEYVGLDIGKVFLDYLEPHLKRIVKNKPGFSFRLICDDFSNLNYHNHFDLIVFLSTVHHIPNRVELFTKVSQFLKGEGAVLCIEPAHYFPRKLTLIRRLPRYLRKSFYSKDENLSTHHMCAFEEFKEICKKSGLRIDKKWCILPKKIFHKKIIKDTFFLRFLSAEIGILLRKS